MFGLSETAYLSLLIFFPAITALVVALLPRGADNAYRVVSLIGTVITMLLSLAFLTGFEPDYQGIQLLNSVDWIPSFNIHYLLGLDGISYPLVLLTSILSVLAFLASWPITKHVKAYCILYLLLEMGMLGVFMGLDFFLFYVFWEVMLLPMYFLIGIWGGPRREYAAIKFFLYTLLGSVLMLIAILILYFNSDLRSLNVEQIKTAQLASDTDAEAYHQQLQREPTAQHTFNILALQQMGQNTDLFSSEILFGKSMQWWCFVLLFIGFAVKVPSVPLHTWLPDAHVEAPTPISMILAGVLLKMGGYGIIRICYPICPEAAYDLAYVVCGVGVVSMVYGAFAALAQKDFKRMVAYSSVSHMGYVVLGLGVWSAGLENGYNSEYWKMGMNGAMFQMIAHGISSAGMFFMVGVIYDRVHHRNLEEFGGLFAKMPVYSGLAIVIFFAGLGLPGLCGFIGEVFVTLSVWNFSKVLAVISAGVVILTAGYILWAIQRVYLGAEYKGPHGEALTPITGREMTIAVPLVVLALLFGIFPNQCLLMHMEPSVNRTVDQLVGWQQAHESAAVATIQPETPLVAVAGEPSPTITQP